MRNSSLVEYPCTDDLPGLKRCSEFADLIVFYQVVGERSMWGEGGPEGPLDRMEVSMPA